MVEFRHCFPNAFKKDKFNIFNSPNYQQVRLAEWSKAPDLSSGTRKSAWVRTPYPTMKFCFGYFYVLLINMILLYL